jgi:hypothetical protein
MTRSYFSKVTPPVFAVAAILVASAVAHAQPDGELQPSPAQPGEQKLSPAPAQSPPSVSVPTVQSQPLGLVATPWRPPSAAAEPETPAVPPPKAFFQAQVALRAAYVSDPAFGIFSDDKSLRQLGLAFSRTVLVEKDFSFAPGLSWEYGERNSTVRGDASDLKVHRLSLRIDGRYHVLPWMYAFARLAPGAIHQSMQVDDVMAAAPLRQSSFGPSVDLSAGAAFLIGPHGARPEKHVRFWAEIDGGYGWAARKDIVLSPELASDDVRRVGTLALGDMALRGAFVRVAGTLTF